MKVMKRAWFLAGLVCAMAVLWASAPASAIVVSDDPNSHVVTAPSDYDMVGFFPDYVPGAGGSGATGVLIKPSSGTSGGWYVLTAKHVVNPYTMPYGRLRLDLSGGPQYFDVAEKFVSPTTDLAVVRLARSTSQTGYSLYTGTGSSELNAEAITVGYGMSGTGSTVGEGGDPNYPRGTKRVGYNKIDDIPYYSNVGYTLAMDFDAPDTSGPWGSLGAGKEAMVAAGDSGGPLFLDSGGTLKVAGIAYTVWDKNGNGKYPDYGDFSYHIRVSTNTTWINSVIASSPAPLTGNFNNDSNVNATDIDKLFTQYGKNDMWYDCTGDSVVNTADTDRLIHTYLSTEYGDVGLDHRVDYSDYQVLANHFGMAGGWADGDFNGDKIVNFADYQILEAAYGFGVSGAPLPPLEFIPEPASLAMLLGGGLMLAVRRRRQVL